MYHLTCVQIYTHLKAGLELVFIVPALPPALQQPTQATLFTADPTLRLATVVRARYNILLSVAPRRELFKDHASS